MDCEAACNAGRPSSDTTRNDRQADEQVHVWESAIAIEIDLVALFPDNRRRSSSATHQLKIPVDLARKAGETALVVAGVSGHEAASEPALIKAIARGVSWFDELATGRADTVTAIARREHVTDRYVSQLVELALLSPRIVERALDGVRGMRVSAKQLVFDIELHSAWSEQESQIFR